MQHYTISSISGSSSSESTGFGFDFAATVFEADCRCMMSFKSVGLGVAACGRAAGAAGEGAIAGVLVAAESVGAAVGVS